MKCQKNPELLDRDFT